jgi:hypothetical protein
MKSITIEISEELYLRLKCAHLEDNKPSMRIAVTELLEKYVEGRNYTKALGETLVGMERRGRPKKKK